MSGSGKWAQRCECRMCRVWILLVGENMFEKVGFTKFKLACLRKYRQHAGLWGVIVLGYVHVINFSGHVESGIIWSVQLRT